MLASWASGIPSFSINFQVDGKGNKMRKIIVAALLLALLAGCGTVKLPGLSRDDSSLPSDSSEPPAASQPQSSRPESLPPVKAEPSPAAPEPSAPPASSWAAESSLTGGEEGQEPSSQAAEGSGGQSEDFDAEQAVAIESVDGGIQATFQQLPQTAGDLQALLALYPQSDARHTGAFFLAALVRYVDSPEDGLEMIDILRGPRPMNDMDKNFIKDRLREKTYLPGAYFQGAAPENDYTPDVPWTLTVYDDPMEAEEGYLYIQVATTGADSRRRITLREKDGQYYLWEYSNVLTGIRLPASQDPWL